MRTQTGKTMGPSPTMMNGMAKQTNPLHLIFLVRFQTLQPPFEIDQQSAHQLWPWSYTGCWAFPEDSLAPVLPIVWSYVAVARSSRRQDVANRLHEFTGHPFFCNGFFVLRLPSRDPVSQQHASSDQMCNSAERAKLDESIAEKFCT